MARQAAFRQEKSNNSGMLIFILLLLVMFIGLQIHVGRMKTKCGELEQEHEALVREMEEEDAYSTYLEEYKKYTKTRKYKEEAARERLGLVYSDEIVFKPED